MGHLDNSAFIGAIALGSTIFTFIYAGFGFLRMGTSGFTAQAYGAGLLDESILTLSRSILIAAFSAFVMIALQIPIANFGFWLINGSNEVESLAREYFFIRIWAAPATLGIYALSGWFIGMQNSRIPMLVAIIVNIANILFSASFIFLFDMKSDGVALGTVLAQYSGLILSLFFFKKHFFKLTKHIRRNAILDWRSIRAFTKVNSDILIRSLLLTGTFFYFTAESAIFGNDILAVNSLMLQFLWILSYFIDGFALAAEALVGKAIGAKNKSMLHKTVKLLFRMGFAVCVVLTLLFIFGNEYIFKILTDKDTIIQMSRDYEFWLWLMPLTVFSAFIWDGIYIGATASKAMRNTMIVSSIFIFLPSYHLLKPLIGNHALWTAIMLFMASRGISLSVMANKTIFAILNKNNNQ